MPDRPVAPRKHSRSLLAIRPYPQVATSLPPFLAASPFDGRLSQQPILRGALTREFVDQQIVDPLTHRVSTEPPLPVLWSLISRQIPFEPTDTDQEDPGALRLPVAKRSGRVCGQQVTQAVDEGVSVPEFLLIPLQLLGVTPL